MRAHATAMGAAATPSQRRRLPCGALSWSSTSPWVSARAVRISPRKDCSTPMNSTARAMNSMIVEDSTALYWTVLSNHGMP